MTIQTIKFSQMTSAGNISNNSEIPGLGNNGGNPSNVLFTTPWTFLPSGSTADRPAPIPSIYYLLRFNTTTLLYEYYNPSLPGWEMVASSSGTPTSITGTANQVLANGTSGIPITGTDVILTTPQDIAPSSSPTFENIALTSVSQHGIILGEGSSFLNSVVLSAGQLLIGTLGGDPVGATLTPGLNIGITNASGSVTISLSGIVAIGNGGTGSNVVITSPIANSWAGWDSHENFFANNFIPGLSTTATTGGSTSINVGTPYWQVYTGSNSETIQMPIVSTLTVGQSWGFINNSTGALTINSSGGNLICTVASGQFAILVCTLNSGTTAASWSVALIAQTAGGVATITGTAHQVIASSSTGNIVLSTPQDIDTSSSPTFAGMTLTTPLGVGSGGTGVSSVTVVPNANHFAGWDANDNLSANNFIAGFATTVSSITPIVLTVASAEQQYITGSTAQTVTMPVVSTLVQGMSWTVVNLSSATTTVQSSGGNSIVSLPPSSQATLTCILTSGTTAASWADNFSQSSAGVSSITGTANQVIASAPTGAVVLSLPQNINTTATPQFANVIQGYTTTVTAAGNTTLTVTSNRQQFFTGSSTQTVIMPVTSTLTLGQSWIITNNSTGTVTVISSGGSTIATLTANTYSTITCILTSGTTAASWNATNPSSIFTINVQTFTSNGTYTPTAGMKYCKIEMVGGGGAGGGTSTAAAGTGAGAGGGGSGAYNFNFFTAATIGASQTVTIGAGGVGATGAVGGNGGATSVGSLLTAPGGAGGSARAAQASVVIAIGGNGGVAGIGGINNFIGQTGGLGINSAINAGSGFGGSSFFAGGGAPIGVAAGFSAGNFAQANSGAGGSGSAIYGVTGSNVAGGNGGAGIVIITEYI